MPGETEWTGESRLVAGTRLKRVRIQQGLSVRSLADIANVSKTSIVAVETGRASRRSTYLKVAAALGLHLENLVQSGSADGLPYAVHCTKDDRWFDLAQFDEGPLSPNAQTDSHTRGKGSRYPAKHPCQPS